MSENNTKFYINGDWVDPITLTCSTSSTLRMKRWPVRSASAALRTSTTP